MKKIVDFLTLFCSTGTLLCCALPATLAAIAGGGAVVSLITWIPGFVLIGKYKDLIFLAAAVMLAVNGYLMKRAESQPCPIDPGQREACQSGRKFGKIMYWVSVAIMAAGGFFAYVMPLID